MITLHHVRYGHANNSSSSHSILLSKDKISGDEYPSGSYFGWDDFLLTSLTAKVHYLFGQVLENITEEHLSDIKSRFEKAMELFSLFGYYEEIKPILNSIEVPEDWGDLGVDHESVLTLPRNKIDGGIHVGFVENLFKEILFNENIIITGGNDNSCGSSTDYLKKNAEILFDEITDSYGKLWCRFDPKNKNFVIYNEKNGNKLTMSFGGKK
jgi:hypothetical protein